MKIDSFSIDYINITLIVEIFMVVLNEVWFYFVPSIRTSINRNESKVTWIIWSFDEPLKMIDIRFLY